MFFAYKWKRRRREPILWLIYLYWLNSVYVINMTRLFVLTTDEIVGVVHQLQAWLIDFYARRVHESFICLIYK